VEKHETGRTHTKGANKLTSEEIKDKYEKRILLILSDITDCLKDGGEGWKVGAVDEMHDDEYCWGMLISKTDENPSELNEDDIDIKLTILESEHNDGEEEGMSFSLEAVTVGGSQVARLCPYNYTEKVWVPRANAKAVEERFNIIQQADVAELVYIINHHE